MATSCTEKPLYLGIDGGGTKCRASIMTHDFQLLGTGLGGPANPFHGIQQAQASICAAAQQALLDAALPPAMLGELIAGVGLAGVNVPSLYQAMSTWQHPFRHMHLTTDLHIACLGAHKRNHGAVLICGTGSCGYALINQTPLFIGGHGFPLGDKGSGAWMGLAAIQAVLLAADGLGPATSLSALIRDFFQADGILLVDKMFGATASDYAKCATVVVDAAAAGDAVASDILTEGAAYLSAVARQLWAADPGRMSMIGGLAARLMPWMDEEVIATLSPALGPPEVGAVHFAMQQVASCV